MVQSDMMMTPTLLKQFPIISDQVDAKELAVILQELERLLVANQRGSVVEFGCYSGTTSLFIRRLLDHYGSNDGFHVYDSFEGLPDKTEADQSVVGDQFVTGALKAPRRMFIENFKKAGLQLPVIHKGWFSDVAAGDVPNDIMFAFLDGDYYESIRDSLRLVTPKLQPGAVVVIDDYASEALPGAAKAAKQWAVTKGYRIQSIASLGVVHIS